MLKVALSADFDPELILGLCSLEQDFFDVFFSNSNLDISFLRKIFNDLKSDHFPSFFLKLNENTAGVVCAFPAVEMSRRRLFTTMSLMRHFGQNEQIKERFRNFKKELTPIKENSFYLSKIFIKSNHRSMGAGQLAMGELFRQAALNGYQFVTLHVAVDNALAYRFYIKQGFEEVSSNDFFRTMEKKL